MNWLISISFHHIYYSIYMISIGVTQILSDDYVYICLFYRGDVFANIMDDVFRVVPIVDLVSCFIILLHERFHANVEVKDKIVFKEHIYTSSERDKHNIM